MASCASLNMPQNEDDIETGLDDKQQQCSDAVCQDSPTIVVTTPNLLNGDGDAEIRSMGPAHEAPKKNLEYRLLETISDTLEAQNKLMAEQKKILEAMASKYKISHGKSFLY